MNDGGIARAHKRIVVAQQADFFFVKFRFAGFGENDRFLFVYLAFNTIFPTLLPPCISSCASSACAMG